MKDILFDPEINSNVSDENDKKNIIDDINIFSDNVETVFNSGFNFTSNPIAYGLEESVRNTVRGINALANKSGENDNIIIEKDVVTDFSNLKNECGRMAGEMDSISSAITQLETAWSDGDARDKYIEIAKGFSATIKAGIDVIEKDGDYSKITVENYITSDTESSNALETDAKTSLEWQENYPGNSDFNIGNTNDAAYFAALAGGAFGFGGSGDNSSGINASSNQTGTLSDDNLGYNSSNNGGSGSSSGGGVGGISSGSVINNSNSNGEILEEFDMAGAHVTVIKCDDGHLKINIITSGNKNFNSDGFKEITTYLKGKYGVDSNYEINVDGKTTFSGMLSMII